MSLPMYPEYKDSGVEWLGRVPTHWQVLRLKYACEVFPSNVDKHSRDNEPAVRLCNYTDVYYNERITSDMQFMEATALPDQIERFTLMAGDTIITKDSETADDIAIAAYVPQNLPNVVCGYHLSMVRPRGGTSGAFVKRLFDSLYAKARFAVAANGLTRVGLGQYALDNVEMPFPPMAEQAAIAAFLDCETAKIDALIAEQEKLINLLSEKRQALISHAVSRGLDPDVPMKDSGVAWLGPIPAHWAVSQSRRLFAVRSEAALASDKMLTASQKYGVLFQSDFVEREGRRVVEVILGVESLKHVEPDDFIISMRSFQGGIEWCKLRGSTSFHYVMLRPVKWVHPPFFAHLFKSSCYIQALRTTTDLIRDGQELRFSNFAQVDLPVVPLEEQRRIALFLDQEILKFDRLASASAHGIRLLKERRSALIAAAVTGQIDVRNAVKPAAEYAAFAT